MALQAAEQGASPAVVDPPDPPVRSGREPIVASLISHLRLLTPPGCAQLDPGDTDEIAVVACPPDDALVDIFSRVPIKSLCRFKCVSKAWCGLIDDRLHCRKLPQTLEGFFYFGDGVGEGDSGGQGDGGNKDGKGDGSKNLTYRGHGQFVNLLGRSVPLFDRSFSFLLEHPSIETIRLLRSCNGLFLFGHRRPQSDRYSSLGYIVCNPVTEQWVAVPSSGWTPSPPDGGFIPMHRLYTYLIFDPAVSPDFQLVQFWQECNFLGVAGLHTYSSKTGVWRDWAAEWRLMEKGGEWGRWGRTGLSMSQGSAFVNGMVHFVVYNNDKHHQMIVTVDREGKISWIIRWPKERGTLAFIGGSQGHLHCMSDYWNDDREERSLSIWVLEDYDTEEWALKHTVNLLQVFGRMSPSQTSLEFDLLFKRTSSQISYADNVAFIHSDYDVVAIHPDRNLIFFVQHWNQKLISYDMDSKELCALHALGHGYHSIVPYVPYFAESSVLAKNGLYSEREAYKWLKNGMVGISKVKTAIWNYFTS